VAPAFRSGYERTVAACLTSLGIPIAYELAKFKFYVPETGRLCAQCAGTSVVRISTYMPDFKLSEFVFLEAKGKLTASNRRRMVAFSEQHKGVKLIFMFQRDNWLTSKKLGKYSDWAKAKGFPYVVGDRITREFLSKEGVSC